MPQPTTILRAAWPLLMWVALVCAAAVPALVANDTQNRTLRLYNIHSKETLVVEYKRAGKYVPEAMEKVNWMLRDWRRNEPTTMAPELVDLLWEIHTELGSKEPIHIISGYRSRATNEMLRATVGGQASESKHILGRAADVHFPDVPLKRIRYSALIRERGGVGYYPTSAIPFVHVDVDRVRAWPRLPRYELALLFPDGKTKHLPADGGPLTPADVQTARAQHADAAQQVAEYFDLRRRAFQASQGVAVADAGRAPPAPSPTPPKSKGTVVAALTPPAATPIVPPEPRLVDRPSRLVPAEDRSKLAELAARASAPQLVKGPELVARPPRQTSGPQLAALSPPRDTSKMTDLGADTTWAVAAEYDDDHPDELAYRPFPIEPFMTDTPSADDPKLAILFHPDAARTLDLLDQAGSVPPMRLRPGGQLARMMWAQSFQGSAVASDLNMGEPPAPASRLTDRKVKTATP